MAYSTSAGHFSDQRTKFSDSLAFDRDQLDDETWRDLQEPAPCDEVAALRRDQALRPRSRARQIMVHILHGDVAHVFYRYFPGMDVWLAILVTSPWIAWSWRLVAEVAMAWIALITWYRLTRSPARFRKGSLGFMSSKDRTRLFWTVAVLYFALALSHLRVVKALAITAVTVGLVALYAVLSPSFYIIPPNQSERSPLLEEYVYPDSLETNWRHLSHPMSCEIRLLRLHPWRPFQPLKATLYSTTLDMARDYTAISYTWGASPTKSKSLVINGKQFGCTEATYNALYRASRTWSSHLVWIDYVCINQSNNKEKGGQVELMRHIYARATNVRAQIVPPVVESASKRVAADTEGVSVLIRRLATYIDDWNPSHQEIIEFLKRDMETYGESRLVNLVDFLANAWFTRVWIIQEVITAPMVTVHYDDSFIASGSLTLVAGALAEKELLPLLRRHSRNGDRARKNALRFKSILRIRHLHKVFVSFAPYMHGDPDIAAMFRVAMSFTVTPLSMLLSECSSFEATNPRDKVYALLGLIMDGKSLDMSSSLLWPNYSNSVSEVMKSAAKYLVERRNIFDSLSNVGVGLHTGKGTQDLPSWVPDWAAPPICAPLHTPMSPDVKKSRYRASKGSRPYLAWGSVPDSLVMSGGCIDMIVDVGPVNIPIDAADHPDKDVRDSHFNEVRRMLDWQDGSSEFIQRWHEESMRYTALSGDELAWRVLIGDRSPLERPAPREVGDYCMHWRKEAESIVNPTKDINTRWRDGNIEPSSQEAIAWREALEWSAVGRRVFFTARGFVGMGPPGAKFGDEIVLIFGAATPFAVRHPEGMHCDVLSGLGCTLPFRLIGECYIHGLMDGEGVQFVTSEGGDNLHFV